MNGDFELLLRRGNEVGVSVSVSADEISYLTCLNCLKPPLMRSVSAAMLAMPSPGMIPLPLPLAAFCTFPLPLCIGGRELEPPEEETESQ